MDEIPSRDLVEIDRHKLRHLRHQQRCTQVEVSKLAGLRSKSGYISRLERGKRRYVSRAVFDRLCAALGVQDAPELLMADRPAVAS